MTMNNKQNLGFYISLTGTVLILLWVGYYKFTPTEAAAIQPLVSNHPLTYWMYNIMSTQVVSNFIGIFEITTAILILVGLKYKIIAKIASLAVIVMFLMTISYLFTTPGTWKHVDGVPITNFFMLKDIMYLGFGVTFFQYSNS
ncbi:DUF417 family protein [Sphingobacterium rhinopitheci]|nr:DUF417 family protein [Sphingobacterium rhinopitheci]